MYYYGIPEGIPLPELTAMLSPVDSTASSPEQPHRYIPKTLL